MDGSNGIHGRRGSFGWIRDTPDKRDHLFVTPPVTALALPPRVNLQRQMPPVYDQGKLGSCTANAIAAAVEFVHAPSFVPSRLFIYYNERAIEGSIGTDSGAQLRDGIKSVATLGVCKESIWPYTIVHFREKPSPAAYADAAKTKAVEYLRLSRDLSQMKGCLAAGFPFVFGFNVYADFESARVARTGTVKLPKPGEKMAGGHAVLAVGYDDAKQTFRIRNSWGTGWGQNGYFTMPYAYLRDPHLALDFWTIRKST